MGWETLRIGVGSKNKMVEKEKFETLSFRARSGICHHGMLRKDKDCYCRSEGVWWLMVWENTSNQRYSERQDGGKESSGHLTLG